MSAGDQVAAFNGIDGSTSEYLQPPASVHELALIARGLPSQRDNLDELKWRHQQETEKKYAVKEGVDPKNLAETGWGVIFAANADPAVHAALAPLLEWRKKQAGAKKERLYREYAGVQAYRPGESKLDFLARNGAGPGPVDPDKVPYYLLIVGDPETIPYRFQYQLDVQYAVGRLHFDTPEEYARYAQSVVEAESGKLALGRRAAFFGVANHNDGATQLSSQDLVQPLVQSTKEDKPDWEILTAFAEEATKARLGDLLGASNTPALLFTASHGMWFPNGDARQLPCQGALLCQDWPGPGSGAGKPVSGDYFFAGEDIASDANLLGLITMHFACFGAGTPKEQDFVQVGAKERAAMAPNAFVSRLPQRLLAHPKGGALAAIGHVERCWGYSFKWDRAGRQLQVFQSTLKRLMEGHPVGSALEYFNARYAELSSDLSAELEEIRFGKVVNEYALSGMWTFNNDARSYAVVGDPAVRLVLSEGDGAEKRPVLERITVFAPPAEVVASAKIAAPARAQTMTIATYVSGNLAEVKVEGGKFTGAELRALTQVDPDGNMLVCVPEQPGKMDEALWKIHSDAVAQALALKPEPSAPRRDAPAQATLPHE